MKAVDPNEKLLKTLDEDTKHTENAIRKIIKNSVKSNKSSVSVTAGLKSNVSASRRQLVNRAMSRGFTQSSSVLKARPADGGALNHGKKSVSSVNATPTPLQKKIQTQFQQLDVHTPKLESRVKRRRK